MKPRKSKPAEKKPSHSTISSKNYSLYPTENFIAEAKKLKKKYPSIEDDFYMLQQRLKNNPITGNDNLGKNCYKVRMAIPIKIRGKRWGKSYN